MFTACFYCAFHGVLVFAYAVLMFVDSE